MNLYRPIDHDNFQRVPSVQSGQHLVYTNGKMRMSFSKGKMSFHALIVLCTMTSGHKESNKVKNVEGIKRK